MFVCSIRTVATMVEGQVGPSILQIKKTTEAEIDNLLLVPPPPSDFRSFLQYWICTPIFFIFNFADHEQRNSWKCLSWFYRLLFCSTRFKLFPPLLFLWPLINFFWYFLTITAIEIQNSSLKTNNSDFLKVVWAVTSYVIE